ncbi:MAG: hypothetical protein R3C97_04600 [Geminicoccaceae bacterium]
MRNEEFELFFRWSLASTLSGSSCLKRRRRWRDEAVVIGLLESRPAWNRPARIAGPMVRGLGAKVTG